MPAFDLSLRWRRSASAQSCGFLPQQVRMRRQCLSAQKRNEPSRSHCARAIRVMRLESGTVSHSSSVSRPGKQRVWLAKLFLRRFSVRATPSPVRHPEALDQRSSLERRRPERRGRTLRGSLRSHLRVTDNTHRSRDAAASGFCESHFHESHESRSSGLLPAHDPEKWTSGFRKRSCAKKEGGGAPTGASTAGVRAASRPSPCGKAPGNRHGAHLVAEARSPFGAPPRFYAEGFIPRLGRGRASWNHRMQTGGPSPAPVQRAPRRPPRGGRADTQTARGAQRMTASREPLRPRPSGVPSRQASLVSRMMVM
jgi:hypothetical protein